LPSDEADDDERDDADDGCDQQHAFERDRAKTPSRDRMLGHALLPPHGWERPTLGVKYDEAPTDIGKAAGVQRREGY